MNRKRSINKIKGDRSRVIINILGYVFVGSFALLCLFPLILLVSASFTEEYTLMHDGIRIIPKEFSLEAYKAILNDPLPLVKSFGLSVGLVVFGTTGSLFFNSMAGYALARQDFKYRNVIVLYLYLSGLFNAGLVAYYLMFVNDFGWRNNYIVLLLPGMISTWNIVMVKNFMKDVPYSLIESAKMDGAGDFTIYVKITLPLIKPVLATIGLYAAIGYWNEWYNSMLYIGDHMVQPLQMYLYNIMNKAKFLEEIQRQFGVVIEEEIPSESLKMAVAIISIVPVLIVYPFIQKFFIAGVTVGSVKG